jgi:hypothetical protein
MSERDRARSKDYFFRTPGANVDNRIDEPAHVTAARNLMSTPELEYAWRKPLLPMTPLSKLGQQLGAQDIARPSPEEVAKYLANIDALNAPPTFNQRWPDDLQMTGMRPMSPSTERGFTSLPPNYSPEDLARWRREAGYQ